MERRVIPEMISKPGNSKHGLTLIEMLIVIAILGILMGLLIPAFGPVIRKAKIKRSEGDAQALGQAFVRYYHAYDRWPVTTYPETDLIFTNNNEEIIAWLLSDHAQNPQKQAFWTKRGMAMNAFLVPYTITILANNDLRIMSTHTNYGSKTFNFDPL